MHRSCFFTPSGSSPGARLEMPSLPTCLDCRRSKQGRPLVVPGKLVALAHEIATSWRK
jgi:hypothetical protein